MKSEKSHIYELGKFKFNKTADVDLLKYEEIHFGQQTKSTSFRLSRTIIVAEFKKPYYECIKFVVPYDSPKAATKALLEGLEVAIGKVNENLQKACSLKKFQIDLNKFEVCEYAKVKTCSDGFEVFFPVEVKQSVAINGEIFEVSINLDNPTSLSQGNQENGCQGSHFGYTIIKCDGTRTRGHVLITTFVGFPSRNENSKLLPPKTSSTKLLSFGKLCKTALDVKNLSFDITTGKGICGDQTSYQTNRTKQLPYQLQILHITFTGNQFILPSRKNISQFCDR